GPRHAFRVQSGGVAVPQHGRVPVGRRHRRGRGEDSGARGIRPHRQEHRPPRREPGRLLRGHEGTHAHDARGDRGHSQGLSDRHRHRALQHARVRQLQEGRRRQPRHPAPDLRLRRGPRDAGRHPRGRGPGLQDRPDADLAKSGKGHPGPAV
ncbi:hypothetical protein OY671_012382, partial [Metschnikowia pulcherrima]